MMKKILILPLLLLLSGFSAIAQDRGITFGLGPSVSLYYGDADDTFEYSTERLSWQLNGQFGYCVTGYDSLRTNMIGIFASCGNTNPEVLRLMKSGNSSMPSNIRYNKGFNGYYSLEGGLIISGLLRMSGGVGSQTFTYIVSETDEFGRTRLKETDGKINYYSGTAGFVINMGIINWVIDANVITGKDLDQSILRFSTGFVVKF